MGLAVAMTAAAATAGPATAGGVDWSGPLYRLDEGGSVDFDDPVEGSRAAYANGGRAISFGVAAPDLEEGHGYTVWLMVFNHPEFCLAGADDPSLGLRCGMGDHLNPATGFSIMYGAGAWADDDVVHFRGQRPANTVTNRPSDVLLGPGLVNPAGAEVHLRVRDHGPPQDGLEDDQIGTFGGGCDTESAPPLLGEGARGTYACADIQGTAS